MPSGLAPPGEASHTITHETPFLFAARSSSSRHMIRALLPLLCAALSIPAASPAACDSSTFLGAAHAPVPCLDVPSCASAAGPAMIGSLELWSGKNAFSAGTTIAICHDESAGSLNVTYAAADDKIMVNDYHDCNSETWNQEVMEMFLAPGEAAGKDPSLYQEFEITPSGTFYHARINNPYHNGTDKVRARFCAWPIPRFPSWRGLRLAFLFCLPYMYLSNSRTAFVLLLLLLLLLFSPALLATHTRPTTCSLATPSKPAAAPGAPQTTRPTARGALTLEFPCLKQPQMWLPAFTVPTSSACS